MLTVRRCTNRATRTKQSQFAHAQSLGEQQYLVLMAAMAVAAGVVWADGRRQNADAYMYMLGPNATVLRPSNKFQFKNGMLVRTHARTH